MLPVDRYTPVVDLKITVQNEAKDLTPDFVKFTTHKGLGEPTGTWSIILKSRKDNQGKTWFDKIRPQDMVVIRFARLAKNKAKPPVIMRGFVDNVRETYAIDDQGKPHRAILINGRDYGKLLLVIKVYYLYELDPVASLLNDNRLEANFGIPSGELKPNQFIELVNEKIILPEITKMQKFNKYLMPLEIAASVADYYRVNTFQVQAFAGSVWNLMDYYSNIPWCELFVTEGETAPLLIFRPTPFKNRSGQYTQSGGTITEVPISKRDIETMDLGYSDNEAYSYFFTYATQALISKIAFKAESVQLQSIEEGRNTSTPSNPTILEESLNKYGFRPLELESPFIPILQGNKENEIMPKDVRDMSLRMNKWLVDVFGHNQDLRNGTITIKGYEEARIGRCLTIDDKEEYYIESVDHEVTAFETAKSTLGVTRGRDK
ncbi:MAG: hypothetical protein ACYCX4_01755 [Bacillota bacterium]